MSISPEEVKEMIRETFREEIKKIKVTGINGLRGEIVEKDGEFVIVLPIYIGTDAVQRNNDTLYITLKEDD